MNQKQNKKVYVTVLLFLFYIQYEFMKKARNTERFA